MALHRSNIVQAEFFHIGKGDTLESVIEEGLRRIEENVEYLIEEALDTDMRSSGIKTVVRFLDQDGSITKFVSAAAALRERMDSLFEEIEGAGKLRCWFIDVRGRMLLRKMVIFRQSLKDVVLCGFRRALADTESLAIEKWDHSFRMVRRAEIHDLQEAVNGAYSVWIFIFKPNDILSDTNVLVASGM